MSTKSPPAINRAPTICRIRMSYLFGAGRTETPLKSFKRKPTCIPANQWDRCRVICVTDKQLTPDRGPGFKLEPRHWQFANSAGRIARRLHYSSPQRQLRRADSQSHAPGGAVGFEARCRAVFA